MIEACELPHRRCAAPPLGGEEAWFAGVPHRRYAAPPLGGEEAWFAGVPHRRCAARPLGGEEVWFAGVPHRRYAARPLGGKGAILAVRLVVFYRRWDDVSGGLKAKGFRVGAVVASHHVGQGFADLIADGSRRLVGQCVDQFLQ